MDHRRRTLALLLAVGSAPLCGCYIRPAPPTGCVPRITVTPAVASPGDTITLRSDTSCDDAPPEGGWIVTAAHVGSGAVLAETTSDNQFDGSFVSTLILPDDFPHGEAYAEVADWDYSFCESTGSGSCASASSEFTVQP